MCNLFFASVFARTSTTLCVAVLVGGMGTAFARGAADSDYDGVPDDRDICPKNHPAKDAAGRLQVSPGGVDGPLFGATQGLAGGSVRL